jgi:CPA2 family monovalent cation:H+ antiporter-2
VIRKGSGIIDKTIRESGLRERAHALVVGIERENERILNPDSEIRFQPNDNLFIVANKRTVREFFRQFEREQVAE